MMMWPFPDDGSFFSERRRFPATEDPDVRLTYRVAEALLSDARTRHQRVAVGVQNRVVLLSGTVDSWSAEHAAGDTARGVAGVADICNMLRVTRDDDAEPGATVGEFQRIVAGLQAQDPSGGTSPRKPPRSVVMWSVLAAGTWVVLTLLMVTSRWTGVALTCLTIGLILTAVNWRRKRPTDSASAARR